MRARPALAVVLSLAACTGSGGGSREGGAAAGTTDGAAASGGSGGVAVRDASGGAAASGGSGGVAARDAAGGAAGADAAQGADGRSPNSGGAGGQRDGATTVPDAAAGPDAAARAPDVGPAPAALGAYPFVPSTVTRGGTITFTNIGAAGWWPRRIDRASGDSACDYKDGTDTWGAHCCQKKQSTASTTLSPFDQEMTLILKAIDVKQLAVYQPAAPGSGVAWQRVTSWDSRSKQPENLWFTQSGDGSTTFPGDLSHNDCVGYLSQAPTFDCGDGRDYYCPKDPGVLHRGFSGSKLVVFLGSMTFNDTGVSACSGSGTSNPGPWVAFVASELIRDGGRKWNGLCNCYSKTGTVGDGCGEINVFEVVMDNNSYSNREFASTGVRSYQAGSLGGSVCMSTCDRNAFAADVDVVDACAKTAYSKGPEVAAGGASDGCPVWRRPDGDRYFLIALDEAQREIQVAIIHPANIPAAAAAVLPEMPGAVDRAGIQSILDMRLPN